MILACIMMLYIFNS